MAIAGRPLELEGAYERHSALYESDFNSEHRFNEVIPEI